MGEGLWVLTEDGFTGFGQSQEVLQGERGSGAQNHRALPGTELAGTLRGASQPPHLSGIPGFLSSLGSGLLTSQPEHKSC